MKKIIIYYINANYIYFYADIKKFSANIVSDIYNLV